MFHHKHRFTAGSGAEHITADNMVFSILSRQPFPYKLDRTSYMLLGQAANSFYSKLSMKFKGLDSSLKFKFPFHSAWRKTFKAGKIFTKITSSSF